MKAALTQEKLADLADMDRAYVGAVERSERNPSLANVERLADALDVPVYWLLAPHVLDAVPALDSVTASAQEPISVR